MLAAGVAGFVLGVSRQRQQAAHNYRLALFPLLHRPGRLGSPDPIPKLNLHAPERLDTYRCRGSVRASHHAFREPSRETGTRTSHGLAIREGAPSTGTDSNRHTLSIDDSQPPLTFNYHSNPIPSNRAFILSVCHQSSEAAAVESSSIIDTKTCLSHQILPLRNECGR